MKVVAKLVAIGDTEYFLYVDRPRVESFQDFVHWNEWAKATVVREYEVQSFDLNAFLLNYSLEAALVACEIVPDICALKPIGPRPGSRHSPRTWSTIGPGLRSFGRGGNELDNGLPIMRAMISAIVVPTVA